MSGEGHLPSRTCAPLPCYVMKPLLITAFLGLTLTAQAAPTPPTLLPLLGSASVIQSSEENNNIAQELFIFYFDILDRRDRAEKQVQAKAYQDASNGYAMIDGASQEWGFLKAKLGGIINETAELKNGEVIKVKDMVAKLDKIIGGAGARSLELQGKSDGAHQDLANEWKKAAQKNLKGDRLSVFNRFGIPNTLLPGDTYTGDKDIALSMKNMNKATTWQYSFYQTADGGFYCNVKATFKGNKLTAKSVGASVTYSEAQSYCKSNYGF